MSRFFLTVVCTNLFFFSLAPAVEAAPAQGEPEAIPAEIAEYLPFLVGAVVVLGVILVGLALRGAKRSEADLPPAQERLHEPQRIEQQELVHPSNPQPQQTQPVTVVVTVPSAPSPSPRIPGQLVKLVPLIAVVILGISIKSIYSVVTTVITSPGGMPTNLESGFMQPVPEVNTPQYLPPPPTRFQSPPPKNPANVKPNNPPRR
jgi:hypothetical protein